MNNKHLISLLQKGFVTVAVRFVQGNQGYNALFNNPSNVETTRKLNHISGLTNPSDRMYTYKCFHKDPQVGEIFVAETRSGLKLVQVVEVHNEPQIDVDSTIEYRWLMARVDYADYMVILEKEWQLHKAMRDAEVAARTANIREHLLNGVPESHRQSFEDAIALNDLSRSEAKSAE